MFASIFVIVMIITTMFVELEKNIYDNRVRDHSLPLFFVEFFGGGGVVVCLLNMTLNCSPNKASLKCMKRFPNLGPMNHFRARELVCIPDQLGK